MGNLLSKGEVVIYKSSDGAVSLDVKLEHDTIWLTQKSMAELFGVKIPAINKHISGIYKDEELNEEATISKMEIVQKEGNRTVSRETTFYNLDMIIAVGYRVNSKKATQFRIWANSVLKEYIIKGFAMDDERLKGNGGGNYWKELLDRIRDIRSSEKVLYRQVLDLYATSVDYKTVSREYLCIRYDCKAQKRHVSFRF